MTNDRTRKQTGLRILIATGLMLSAVLTSFMSASAVAATLDFNLSAPTSGTISYNGSGGGLIGSNIEVDNVVGLSTTANDNVTSLCLSCVLNFSSGTLTGSGGPPPSGVNNGWWRFGSGGSITITGGVQLQGSSDIPLGSTLLTGSFDSAFVQDLGANFKVTFGSFSDSKHADLLAYYGLPEGNYQGALTLLFAAPNGGDGSAFTSTSVFSGNIVNAPVPIDPVPVPGAALLFGAGLLSLVSVMRQRFSV